MKQKAKCCYISKHGNDCQSPAKYIIWDGKEPSYDHKIESCTRHVGELLGDSKVPNQVYPIEWEN